MRVLEVGPGNRPAEVYLAGEGVDYFAIEAGARELRDGENSESFEKKLEFLGVSAERARFLYGSLECLDDAIDTCGGFDLVYLANVLGDPWVIERNDSGELCNAEDARSFVSKICSIAREVAVLECYTPISPVTLSDLFGVYDFEEMESKSGAELIELVKTLYPVGHSEIVAKIKSVPSRTYAAKYWSLPLLEPYFVKFGRSDQARLFS